MRSVRLQLVGPLDLQLSYSSRNRIPTLANAGVQTRVPHTCPGLTKTEKMGMAVALIVPTNVALDGIEITTMGLAA